MKLFAITQSKEESGKVRAKAFRRMIWAAVFAAPIVACIGWLASRGWRFYGPAIGLPLVPLFCYAAEFITGIPFSELSTRWDRLKGWQRGISGTLIVVIGGAILFFAFAMVAIYLI